jgi:hypothetical protein
MARAAGASFGRMRGCEEGIMGLMKRQAFGAGALVLFGLGACTVLGPDDREQERDRLEDARRLWRAQAWDSYAFTLQRLCFCAGGTDPAEVVVRSGRRVSVTVLPTGVPVPDQFAPFYLTVEELFDFIEDALDRDAHEVEVTYERTLGYPVSIRIDYIENAIDEEMAYQASNLRPLR